MELEFFNKLMLMDKCIGISKGAIIPIIKENSKKLNEKNK